MAWLSLRLAADGEQAEAWSDALLEAGALSVSIEDQDVDTEREAPQFGEPGLDEPRAWSHNWVVALLPGDADVDAVLASAGVPPDIERRQDVVEEQDWVRLTQSQFEPIRISERLWIVPSWHAPPDPNAIGIILDPGLAFGTGSHPTTRLCLKWLEAHLRGGESVLDYGCGSGILAIAAAKLGATPVVGVDIDPQAVQASRDNAERNGVVVGFGLPDSLPKIPRDEAPARQYLPPAAEVPNAGPTAIYDVLVANILTNPLKALAPALAGRVRPGGRIALSGILEAQVSEVMAIYGDAFEMRAWAMEEGWALLTGTRKAGPTDV
jgi:ribosomal protein L11 methyltransferase